MHHSNAMYIYCGYTNAERLCRFEEECQWQEREVAELRALIYLQIGEREKTRSLLMAMGRRGDGSIVRLAYCLIDSPNCKGSKDRQARLSKEGNPDRRFARPTIYDDETDWWAEERRKQRRARS